MSSTDFASATPSSPSSPDAQVLHVPFKSSLSVPGTPLSPPPPSIKDEDIELLVDQELAKRQSKKGWHRISFPHGHHSPVSPFSPASSKTNNSRGVDSTDGGGAEGSDENAGLTRPARVVPRRTLTDGSVKLERITSDSSDQTSPKGEKLPKAVYRYVDIYENQRGALNLFFHVDDPAPFTKYERDDKGTNQLVQVNLPYTSLADVQLPSADWAWQGPEWLIDMAGDGMTSYDGFQYNNHFQDKGWKPIAPKWHSYVLTCVRRRRWLRLMVYLPSIVSSDSKGTYHSPATHIPTASEPATPHPGVTPISPTIGGWREVEEPRDPLTDVSDIWRGDEHDWDRCHTALKLLRSDGRKLELWSAWIDPPEEEEEGGMLAGIRPSLEKQRWTEDHSTIILDKLDTPADAGPSPISRFLMDEPINIHSPSGADLDTSKAPRGPLESWREGNSDMALLDLRFDNVDYIQPPPVASILSSTIQISKLSLSNAMNPSFTVLPYPHPRSRPSPSETFQTRNALDEIEKEITNLEDQITDFQEQNRKVQARLADLQQQRDNYRSYLSPFRCLPEEILNEVVHICIDNGIPRLKMTQICVKTNPQKDKKDGCCSTGQLELALERAYPSPLDVHICPQDNEEPHLLRLEELKYLCLIDLPEQAIVDVLNLAMQSTKEEITLSLLLPNAYFPRLLEHESTHLIHTSNPHLPQLRSLNIDGDRSFSCLFHPGNVEVVKIGAQLPSAFALDILGNRLTKLTLTETDLVARVVPEGVAFCFPNLERLRLVFVRIEGPLRRYLRMPNLKHLDAIVVNFLPLKGKTTAAEAAELGDISVSDVLFSPQHIGLETIHLEEGLSAHSGSAKLWTLDRFHPSARSKLEAPLISKVALLLVQKAGVNSVDPPDIPV
ncbi:5052_t:CDS:10 [Acaulospora colombiana]|uniref:5052_t:CDS:1 n=1 Tax=Acaulospora colombiana TaxID=27376 RepID=A0ACA9N567_9GLOM|nr:5052_t:CDS:10 [Acaulospora colombiana]